MKIEIEKKIGEKVVRKGGQEGWSELTKRQVEILELIKSLL